MYKEGIKREMRILVTGTGNFDELEFHDLSNYSEKCDTNFGISKGLDEDSTSTITAEKYYLPDWIKMYNEKSKVNKCSKVAVRFMINPGTDLHHCKV